LWSGAPGSRKTQLLSDCIVDWVRQGSRVCIASFEMHPKYTLKRMVKQASNIDRPAREYLAKTLSWLQEGVILYERVGKMSVDTMLEIFDYARAKYGADQFIVDSLMRLGVDSDDYSGQEKVLFKMVDWAQKHAVHLHLVAHTRKGENSKTGVPETDDVKGAMEIGANAFNIILVWRNKKHEDACRAELDVEKRKLMLAESPGVMLNVAKNRNGDWTGKCGLWFSTETYRYSCSPEGDALRNYPIDDVKQAAA
jgi:twinkle protein